MITRLILSYYLRAEDLAKVNREEAIVLSSGDQTQRSRGIKVLDDTTLLSQRIANNPNINQVLSSGEETQRKRRAKDNDNIENDDKDNSKGIGKRNGKGKGK